MKKILGFDSWKGGALNYERYVNDFKASGYEFLLLHIGSWGAEKKFSPEESIGNLTMRDISYYGKTKILKILEIEKPAAVVFLSNEVFAHRAVNRYCRLLGIPTFHIYHGLMGIQSTENNVRFKINIVSQVKHVLVRIPKAILRIWPLYIDSLIKTGANFHQWLRFIKDVFYFGLGKYIPVVAQDSKTNGCIVYTRSDIKHAMQRYDYNENEVFEVGNPDLAKFKFNEQLLGKAVKNDNFSNRELIYIDTGLIYGGMVFSGFEEFSKYLIDLNNTLKSQKFNLSIKLHPDHYRTENPRKLTALGLKIIDDQDFVHCLVNSRAAIVEPSTAALIPALLGLPVLMASFDQLSTQKYGNILIEYPRSKFITDKSKISEIIDETNLVNFQDIEKWICDNCGKLPADEMPKRVVEIINNIINLEEAKN